MNKNTKRNSKFKYKGTILGTSEPIIVKPLKEKKPLPAYMGIKVRVKRKGPWKPIKKTKNSKSPIKKIAGLAQVDWGKGIFTGIYSGGGIETNRRKH